MRPYIGDRIARVDDQVDQDLFYLRWIGKHQLEIVGQFGLQRDGWPTPRDRIPSDCVMTALRFSCCGVVGCWRLNANSCLVNEAVRAGLPVEWLRCFSISGRLGLCESELCAGQLGLEHMATADDDGQHIVEVVRDAPRETADGLQLFRLQQTCFQHLATRDVGQRAMPNRFGHPPTGMEMHGINPYVPFSGCSMGKVASSVSILLAASCNNSLSRSPSARSMRSISSTGHKFAAPAGRHPADRR